MKKIVLIGGSGTIGSILREGFASEFEVVNLDLEVDGENQNDRKVDATDYDELVRNIPRDADVIINLLSKPQTDDLVDVAEMDKLVDVFLKASYHIFQAAIDHGIPKVVVASSNHVTDYYEEDGDSTLGREITVNDYPYSVGLYGTLKLAIENVGFAFHNKHNLSVINLRIGSVKQNEETEIYQDLDRLQHTWLSEIDTVNLFRQAINTDVRFGTYYGVSDNEGKPWDNNKTKRELGFESVWTAEDVIEEGN
ncbi:NAD-dependent epimerase/dehydratase family protein [Sporosarcina jiandibaonis]|uniref:NAD-dependent epimerase/dehydratase family protein n=1 Tax=Sporosarcina jiandibaonis TaxID=2715535 RepID=UPI0015568B46|nr:NAD(P)-dependent oxidoreductase [Sporosarcina jiandibaonis]